MLFFPGALHRRPTLVPSTHRQIVPTPAYEEEVEATFEAPSLAELEAEEARRREKVGKTEFLSLETVAIHSSIYQNNFD